MKADAVSFLETVWLPQDKGSYGCIAWKEGEIWKERYINRDDIEQAWKNDGLNLYFCPNLFPTPRRSNENACPSLWLYADLDDVRPGILDIEPTQAWRTSFGRYQALWQLTRPLGQKAHARLNQCLTYFCEADRGGWSMSKVLRIPGTVSTKYEEPFDVELMWNDGPIYDPKDIWGIVKDARVPACPPVLNIFDMVEVGNWEEEYKLDFKTRQLLRSRHAGDRSGHVYQLACKLNEQQVPMDVAAALLVRTPVMIDKYGERAENQARIVVSKAYAAGRHGKKQKPKQKPEQNGRLLKWTPVSRILGKYYRKQRWMIDGAWSQEAHGLIAGESKAFKTTIALDMAVSVATGTNFLGHFSVPEKGHAIYIQEENREAKMQDLLMKMLYSRGVRHGITVGNGHITIERPEVPMTLVNGQGFDLTSEAHLTELGEMIQELEAKLVVLDPLYLMTPGQDENVASSMAPILRNLLEIKRKTKCGIMIVHHYKKQNRETPFFADEDRISGTSAFQRWYQSLMLVEKGEQHGQVRIHTRHREEPPGDPITVDFNIGKLGETRYEVDLQFESQALASAESLMIEAVQNNPGITVAALSKLMGTRPQTMRRRIEKCRSLRLELRAQGSPLVHARGDS